MSNGFDSIYDYWKGYNVLEPPKIKFKYEFLLPFNEPDYFLTEDILGAEKEKTYLRVVHCFIMYL